MRAILETDVASGRLGNVDAATAATLEKALSGHRINEVEALHLLRLPPTAVPALLAVAGYVRDRRKGKTLTYSPKVFLPITNLCRDFCSYCTFRKSPAEPEAWTMLPEEVRSACRAARRLGCIEALMCLGDKPELAFDAYRSTLAVLGHRSTIEYVLQCCTIALEEGLLPHTNAGLMTREEMRRAKTVNVSLGLMLENVSTRLRQRGGPHHHAPDKDPELRLRMIEEAGELRIPFTTGILLGIGETDAELVRSIAALGELHDRHGHIQEIIVQNFRAKPGTAMAAAAEPQSYDTARVVAVTRLMLPDMNVQAPPNLNPYDLRLLLAAGLNDWGGISPLTRDFVNPEAPWPQVAVLRSTCAAEGFSLQPRLPIYADYVDRPGFLDPALREPVARVSAQRGVPYAL